MLALFRSTLLRFSASAVLRHAAPGLLALMLAASLDGHSTPTWQSPSQRNHARDGVGKFRREMPQTIRADHPAIVELAAAIQSITTDPLQQIVMVNDVTHLLVEYDSDERVYGRSEFHATLDEMLARQRDGGWLYLRDDCDGRAVFAAHILASLGIPWRLEASYWRRHAWVIAQVGAVDYDLLGLRGKPPEDETFMFRLLGRHVVREQQPPPYFPWRQAWMERTAGDLELGKRLGMLEIDSTAENLRQRNSVNWMHAQSDRSLASAQPNAISAAPGDLLPRESSGKTGTASDLGSSGNVEAVN